MPSKCYKCQSESGGPMDIEFSHKGFKFSVFKSGMTCPDCEAEKYKELFDMLVEEEGFITGTPDNLEINWERYCNVRDTRGTKDHIGDLLGALGIFSLDAEGNWCIVTDGEISLNPPVPFGRIFFTRMKDAWDYACVKYANTQYGWELRHTNKVFSKNAVLNGAR